MEKENLKMNTEKAAPAAKRVQKAGPWGTDSAESGVKGYGDGTSYLEESAIPSEPTVPEELKKRKRRGKPESERWYSKIQKPRRFMAFVDVICVLLTLAAVFLLMRYMVNEVFKSNYLKGNYDYSKESHLLWLNMPEGYVPYYNIGNANFQTENYDIAISCYSKALTYVIPEEKECPIRINMALAMLRTIDPEKLTTDKRIENALQQLYAARNILCEKGCAHMDDEDGHNETAQKLKDEIDKMIEELESMLDQQQKEDKGEDEGDGQDEQDNQDQQQDEEKKKTQREKEIEEALENQQKNNMEQRSDEQQKYLESQEENEGGGGSNEDEPGKNW